MDYSKAEISRGEIPTTRRGRSAKAPNASLVAILQEMIRDGMTYSKTITIPDAVSDRQFRRDLERAAAHVKCRYSVRPVEAPGREDYSTSPRLVTFWARPKSAAGRPRTK